MTRRIFFISRSSLYNHLELLSLRIVAGNEIPVDWGVTTFTPGDEVWYTPQIFGGTAWEALIVRAALRERESILIHGGAGGVGHVAIQLAKAMGARVYATVREANFEFARSLRADVVIDYQKEDYADVIMRETGGVGVDVVLDTIGGNTLSRSPDTLAQLGRVVSIVDTARPQNLIQAWGKNASYHFVFTRSSCSPQALRP